MIVASSFRADSSTAKRRAYHVQHRGSAYVFSLILMLVLITVSTSMLMSSTVSVINTDKSIDIHEARFLAESGINYLRFQLESSDIAADVEPDGVLSAIATSLDTTMGASVESGSITKNGNFVIIPAIRPQAGGGTFSAEIYFKDHDPSTNLLRLNVIGTVTGHDGATIERSIETEFAYTPGTQGGGSTYNFADSIFAYGVAVNGPIWMAGNASIWSHGAWNQKVGFYSGYTGDEYIIDLEGSGRVEGPGATPATTITGDFGGNAQINGVTVAWKEEYNWGKNIPELLAEITTGVEPPTFPQVDQEMFQAFVPPDGQGITRTPQVQYWPQYIDTFTNLRVEAGTNPTFGANIKIQGVLYVEAPNRVEFASNSQMTGVIVTEDATDVSGTSEIIFSNDADLYSVDHLPDNDPAVADVKQIRNAAILAPGFHVKVIGGSTSVGGTVMGEQMTISGNGEVSITGAVLMTGDQPIDLRGSGRILVDLSELEESNEMPTGFYYETQTGGETVPGSLDMNTRYWQEY